MNGADLCLVAKQFPQYADILIQYVLNTKEEFERLVTGASLCDIAIAFPKYADALMTHILATDEEYERVVWKSDIGETIDTFPNYADLLIQKMVRNNYFLCAVATRHPQHADTLIQRVLDTPEEFNKLITNGNEFYHTIRAYPQYADRMLGQLFEDNEKFKFFIRDSHDFHMIIASFPNSYYANMLLQQVMTNPEEFNKFLSVKFSLCRIAIAFPEYAETLIQSKLISIEEFDRFAKDSSCDISVVLKAFPRYAEAFTKPTVAEIYHAIKYPQSKAEIVEKSRIIAQGNRTGRNCMFHKLSENVQAAIAGYTGIHDAHNDSKAENPDTIAARNLNKPRS